MTNQEATLKLMSECLYCDSDYTRCNIKDCKIKVAVEALEKQIPKKPKVDIVEWLSAPVPYSCPACGEPVAKYDGFARIYFREHHCKCGQAIDWSENE